MSGFPGKIAWGGSYFGFYCILLTSVSKFALDGYCIYPSPTLPPPPLCAPMHLTYLTHLIRLTLLTRLSCLTCLTNLTRLTCLTCLTHLNCLTCLTCVSFVTCQTNLTRLTCLTCLIVFQQYKCFSYFLGLHGQLPGSASLHRKQLHQGPGDRGHGQPQGSGSSHLLLDV